MCQYFPEPYKSFGENINAKVDFFNYATKADLKNATGIDTSKLALKSNLPSLKPKADKIDAGKLKTVPVDLSKLSNVVNNGAVKETVYDKLVTKVNNIDNRGFVLKTKYDTDKSDLEKKISDADKKIPDAGGLVKKTDYNAKITEREGKIPNISGLATVALTAVGNKIPDVSSLVKKSSDYICFWKSKGLSDESIKPFITSNHSITPELGYFGTKSKIQWNLFKTTKLHILMEK